MTFVCRLATYKYLDMDDVVAQVMVKLGGIPGNAGHQAGTKGRSLPV